MAEATGNVLYLPGQTQKTATTDVEILASYAGLTQKSMTLLKTASTVWEAGTVMKVSGTAKKYAGANKGANEQQTITLGAASAGTITITFQGQTTGSIAFNADNTAVTTALVALSNIDPGDVVVTGGPFPALMTLTFGGQYDTTDVTQITATPTGLTGGTVTIATTVVGGSSADTGLIGFLRQQVDVGTVDKEANIVVSGRIKGSMIRYANDSNGLIVSELVTLASALGGRYIAYDDMLVF